MTPLARLGHLGALVLFEIESTWLYAIAKCLDSQGVVHNINNCFVSETVRELAFSYTTSLHLFMVFIRTLVS